MTARTCRECWDAPAAPNSTICYCCHASLDVPLLTVEEIERLEAELRSGVNAALAQLFPDNPKYR